MAILMIVSMLEVFPLESEKEGIMEKLRWILLFHFGNLVLFPWHSLSGSKSQPAEKNETVCLHSPK
jgi:hypothetical protein